jgi:predicted lipid-binding transport protein (Tim44 family)
LEVNGMHVLHRPHLSGAIAITAIAALLAIILTLAIAGAASEVASAPAPAYAPSAPVAVQASATQSSSSVSPLIRAPFSNPAILENGGSHGATPLGAGR